MTREIFPIPSLSLLSYFSPVRRSAQQYKYPFQNPNLPIEQRVNNILSLMTAGREDRRSEHRSRCPPAGNCRIIAHRGTAWSCAGRPRRLGRPRASTVADHAVSAIGGIGRNMGSGTDPEGRSHRGYEARYTFNTDTQFTTNFRGEKHRRVGIVVRAPNTDLARDPRWGTKRGVLRRRSISYRHNGGSIRTRAARGRSEILAFSFADETLSREQ